MFGCLTARLDPEGRAAADRIERRLDELDWPQVGWLIEHDPHRITIPGHRAREADVHAIWDMDDWESNTYVWIEVDAFVAGRRLPKLFAHGALAGHDGRTLPPSPPASEPVDLKALSAP